jgi:hypothetical protein
MTATLQPDTKSPSRRALLAGALGGIGAWTASAIGRAHPVRAEGEVIHVGDEFSTATSPTRLSNTATAANVFEASSTAGGVGVYGSSNSASGVWGTSSSWWGVFGSSDSGAGVRAQAVSGTGVYGISTSGDGVYGQSPASNGVHGFSSGSIGVRGVSNASNQPATVGWARGNSTGILGYSNNGPGDLPTARIKTGVYGYAAQDSTARGVWGESPAGHGIHGKSASGYAGYFAGKVYVSKFQEMPEISTPSAPAANKARLFVRDNGSGKTQFCVRFPTGAVQVIKTEP